jgi:hypothetical protein
MPVAPEQASIGREPVVALQADHSPWAECQMKSRRLCFFGVLVSASMSAGMPVVPAQSQVLNTRPLSQPYINPNNPNAGDIGSRNNPGYRETSPGTITNQRQNPTMRPNSCWRDSLGQMHCNRGQ